MLQRFSCSLIITCITNNPQRNECNRVAWIENQKILFGKFHSCTHRSIEIVSIGENCKFRNGNSFQFGSAHSHIIKGECEDREPPHTGSNSCSLWVAAVLCEQRQNVGKWHIWFGWCTTARVPYGRYGNGSGKCAIDISFRAWCHCLPKQWLACVCGRVSSKQQQQWMWIRLWDETNAFFPSPTSLPFREGYLRNWRVHEHAEIVYFLANECVDMLCVCFRRNDS